VGGNRSGESNGRPEFIGNILSLRKPFEEGLRTLEVHLKSVRFVFEVLPRIIKRVESVESTAQRALVLGSFAR
jgi:hypothetical protein